MPARLRLPIVLCGLLAASCSALAPLHAGELIVASVPLPGIASPGGLRVTVQSDWAGLGGYRPVEVTIAAPAASVSDQSVRIELGLTRGWQRRASLKVSHTFDWPAGTPSKTVVLSVPRYGAWTSLSIDTWIDGDRQPDLSAERLAIPTSWNLYSPCILFVSDAVPDVSGLGQWLQQQGLLDNQGTNVLVGPSGQIATMATQPGTPVTAVAQPGAYPSLVHRTAAALPEKWLDYSSLTMIICSPDQWQQLQQTNPAAQAAIRAWVAAGGSLVLLGPGAQDSAPAVLDASLEMPYQPEAWRAAGGPSGLVNALRDLLPGGRTAPVTCRWRDQLFGRLVVFGAEAPFPGTGEQWKQLFAAIGAQRFQWPSAHGTSFGQDNQDYWNWLIEGVGLAPVTAFRILITLFVLAIGPINYYYLRRAHRLHLLLFTAPASAILVTAALLTWSVVRDGVAVRARGRSLTMLDQRSGEAACWARTTYYAPLGGRNLRFSDDVMVLPYEAELPDDFREQSGTRHLRWEGGQQLSAGWLPSRTTTQLLTVRARRSPHQLQIQGTDSEGRLLVRNALGVAAERLLVVDENGKSFFGAGIPAGEQAALAPLENDPAVALPAELAAWQTAYQSLAPKDPRLEKSKIDVFNRRRYWRASYAQSQAASTMADGRLESALRAIEMKLFRTYSPSVDVVDVPEATGPYRGPETAALDVLAPRTYVAQVAQSPEAEYGLDGFREESGVHLVVGRW